MDNRQENGMQTKHGAVQSVNENLQRITNASENVSAETLPLLYVQGMPDNQRVFPQDFPN